MVLNGNAFDLDKLKQIKEKFKPKRKQNSYLSHKEWLINIEKKKKEI